MISCDNSDLTNRLYNRLSPHTRKREYDNVHGLYLLSLDPWRNAYVAFQTTACKCISKYVLLSNLASTIMNHDKSIYMTLLSFFVCKVKDVLRISTWW